MEPRATREAGCFKAAARPVASPRPLGHRPDPYVPAPADLALGWADRSGKPCGLTLR